MAIESRILKEAGHARTFTDDIREILGVDVTELPNEAIDKELQVYRAELVIVKCVGTLDWESFETNGDDFLHLYLATAHYLACQLFDGLYNPEIKSEASKDYKYDRFPGGMENAKRAVCHGVTFYLEKLGLKVRPSLCEFSIGGDTAAMQTRPSGM